MKIAQKMLVFLLAVTLVFASAACGTGTSANPPGDTQKPEQPSDPSSQPGEEKEFKVGLLLPGIIADKGWCASAYAGLEKIKNELNVKVSYHENVTASDMEELFRMYAEEGYDLVFGHGFQFTDTAALVGKEYPGMKIIVTSSTLVQEPNVGNLSTDTAQMGYLAGAFCALMSQSNSIGTVNSLELPPIQAFDAAFAKGAKAIKPDIHVASAFVGDWSDAVKAKELAQSMINAGADIICHDADAAALGVFEAAKENDVWCVGVITDQNESAPDNIPVSILGDLGAAMLEVTRYTMEGNFVAREYMLGAKEGCVRLSPYYDPQGRISDDVKAKMDDLLQQLIAGTLDPLA